MVRTGATVAEACAEYLTKGRKVAVTGRMQTRSWDDDRGQRHWKTEIVANHVEMLSGRKKKDYEAQQAADSLVAQAEQFGDVPPSDPIPESAEAIATDDEEDEDAEAAA